MNPTTHAVAAFTAPTQESGLTGITVGADGYLWLTESQANNVGRLDPNTGVVTEYSVPTIGVDPEDITSGPDGNLWFTEQGYIENNPPNYPRVSNIGQVSLGIAAAPDLELAGSAGAGSVPVGARFEYQFTVTNNGTAAATGVTVSDILPTSVTLVGSDIDSAEPPVPGVRTRTGDLIFNIGTLAAGASAGVSIDVVTFVAGTLVDKASVSMDQTDPTPSDNSITLVTPVVTSDIQLSGAESRRRVPVGKSLLFVARVQNSGVTLDTGITLTDTLPGGVGLDMVTVDGVSDPNLFKLVNGVLTFRLDDLEPGGIHDIDITVTPMRPGVLTDRATVSMDQFDPTPNDDKVSLVATASLVTMVGTGCLGKKTAFILSFPEPVDSAWAENPRNYKMVTLDGPRRRIRFKSAKYDAATHTVTLKPLRQPNIHALFRLTVKGPAARSRTDAAHGQNALGAAGPSFSTIVSLADLDVTSKNPTFLRKYNWVLGKQELQMKRLGLD